MTIERKKLKNIYFQPAFLICVAVLAIASSSMSFAVKKFGVILKKAPLPLKKSLELLDQQDLAPYRIIFKHRIENEQMLKTLGTEDYIEWRLVDTEQDTKSPVREIQLFITYYQLPDRIPHVPEECYAGSGYQKIASDNVIFKFKKDGFEKKVPGKYIVFGSTNANIWQSSGKFPVLYFFRINSVYAGNREDARLALNKNIFGRHSYFCKLELAFNRKLVAPTKVQAVTACEKILYIILPVLEKEHWPNLKNSNQ